MGRALKWSGRYDNTAVVFKMTVRLSGDEISSTRTNSDSVILIFSSNCFFFCTSAPTVLFFGLFKELLVRTVDETCSGEIFSSFPGSEIPRIIKEE